MLIVFEGIDGSGKSTQAGRLFDYLKREKPGLWPRLFREPGATYAGEKIRYLLEGRDIRLNPWSKVLLFNAARAELVKSKVIPALAKGDIVILDRYYHSTIAYQVFGDGEPMDMVKSVIERSIFGVKPDMTIFLHVGVERALDRAYRRDIMEKRPSLISDPPDGKGLRYYERVSEGYLQMFEMEENYYVHFERIGFAAEDVHSSLLRHIIPKINEWEKRHENHGNSSLE